MISHERQRDVERKRAERLANREVTVPKCKSKKRRAKLESDDAAWLRYYCGGAEGFWYEFTFQQRQMIEAIRNAIIYGGDQAIAASRGEGKTSLFERMLLKYTLQGKIKFSVLFAATGAAAENSLQSIKEELESNELLAEDYPEVCVPVRALENTPNRAHYQVVTGNRHDDGKPYSQHSSRFSWCGPEIVFPDVPGSPSAKAIIATRGLDSAVRGLKKHNRRPDVAGIDDPDTEDTARSEDQAKKLEDRIDRAIGGLGGQQKGIARVMLTTMQSRICASWKFCDPEQKPSWFGKKYRFMLKPPKRSEYWERYMQMYAEDLQKVDENGENLDPFARRAHKFYLDNRETMDEGAQVANPHRYDGQELPDGTLLEVSPVQHYYNKQVQTSPEAVATEYDNDPPEELGPIESGITAALIQRQMSGYGRGVVPPGCTVVTQGIDVKKKALHWVVRAWRPDATGFTIDYGVESVHGTVVGSDEGLEAAIVSAIESRWETVVASPYETIEGQPVVMDLTLIDARWQMPAIYEACRRIGRGIMPAVGHGNSAGCVKRVFTSPKKGHGVVVGERWYHRPVDGQAVRLVTSDANYWKAWEHARWLTSVNKPGTMMIHDVESHGLKSHGHMNYASHLTAEIEVEDFSKGVMVRKWIPKPGRAQNHYLDASYMSDVAASIKGIRLIGSKSKNTGPRPTLAELAGGK